MFGCSCRLGGSGGTCMLSGTAMDDRSRHVAPAAPAGARRLSSKLYDGDSRAGARSFLLNVGFTHEDLAKPIVGVMHSWIETMPCNLNHRDLASEVKDGVRA